MALCTDLRARDVCDAERLVGCVDAERFLDFGAADASQQHEIGVDDHLPPLGLVDLALFLGSAY